MDDCVGVPSGSTTLPFSPAKGVCSSLLGVYPSGTEAHRTLSVPVFAMAGQPGGPSGAERVGALPKSAILAPSLSPPPPQMNGSDSPFSSLSPSPSHQNSSASIPSLPMGSPLGDSFPPLSRDDHLHTPVPDASFLRSLKPVEQGSMEKFGPHPLGDVCVRLCSGTSKPCPHVASVNGLRKIVHSCYQSKMEVASVATSSPIESIRCSVPFCSGQSTGNLENPVPSSDYMCSDHGAPRDEGASLASDENT